MSNCDEKLTEVEKGWFSSRAWDTIQVGGLVVLIMSFLLTAIFFSSGCQEKIEQKQVLEKQIEATQTELLKIWVHEKLKEENK